MHFSYAPKIPSKENRTNMVVLEVSLPSGYVAESDALLNVSNAQNVKKVETKNADTVFVVYFDNFIVNRTVCPVFEAYRMQSVDEQKPIPITVYDYYENGKFEMMILIDLMNFFKPKKLK